jgi:hypothetical protein
MAKSHRPQLGSTTPDPSPVPNPANAAGLTGAQRADSWTLGAGGGFAAAPDQPKVPDASAPAVKPIPARPIGTQPSGLVAYGATPLPTQPIAARPIATPARPVPAATTGDAGEERVLEDGAEDDPVDVAARFAPPWLLSMVVHMLLLIIMGLWVTVTFKDDPPLIEMDVYGPTLGDQLLDNSVQITSPLPDPSLEKAALAITELPEVSDPVAVPPPPVFAPTGIASISEGPAPAIGYALSGRQLGRRKALLSIYGGTKTTEDSVALALEWLKRNQQNNGSWSLVGPYADAAFYENTVAATAMALLAFQGAGHTHREGEYKAVVGRGWDYLLKRQDADGLFSSDLVSSMQLLYSHGQATIAVCEIFGMTKDPKFQGPAERAIRYCIRAQAAEGGWRYMPNSDSDMSVTGWFVMGLQSARMAGIEVPQATLDNVTKFIDSVSLENGSRYTYKPGQPLEGPAMTAEALLCRQYLGWKRDDTRLVKGLAYLTDNLIGKGESDVYYWYYATQACHHMEGETWNKWNGIMRQTLPSTQVKTGAESGSWDPGGDKWGPQGGRLYVTCLSTYMLEIYYRHMPLYTNVFEKP